MKAGIYKITNLVNGKFYIGSSVDIKARWRAHKSQLRRNIHTNKYLQESWNKHSEGNFKFEVVCHTLDNGHLLPVEEFYIDVLNPVYNMKRKPTANGLGKSFKRGPVSKEVKEKIRQTVTKTTRTEEYRDMCRKKATGNTNRRGKKLTEEQRASIGIRVSVNGVIYSTKKDARKAINVHQAKFDKALSGKIKIENYEIAYI